MYGEPRTESVREWREKVAAWHAEQRKATAASKAAKPGDEVTYDGVVYRLVEPLGRKGWEVRRVRDGAVFRMKCRQIRQSLAA